MCTERYTKELQNESAISLVFTSCHIWQKEVEERKKERKRLYWISTFVFSRRFVSTVLLTFVWDVWSAFCHFVGAWIVGFTVTKCLRFYMTFLLTVSVCEFALPQVYKISLTRIDVRITACCWLLAKKQNAVCREERTERFWDHEQMGVPFPLFVFPLPLFFLLSLCFSFLHGPSHGSQSIGIKADRDFNRMLIQQPANISLA